MKFALANSLIPPNQHDFVPGSSVITSLLFCLDDRTVALDSKAPVDIIYLDFAHAFDKIAFRRLLAKLDHLGVRGHILKWIRSFVSECRFSVRVDGGYSIY